MCTHRSSCSTRSTFSLDFISCLFSIIGWKPYSYRITGTVCIHLSPYYVRITFSLDFISCFFSIIGWKPYSYRITGTVCIHLSPYYIRITASLDFEKKLKIFDCKLKVLTGTVYTKCVYTVRVIVRETHTFPRC